MRPARLRLSGCHRILGYCAAVTFVLAVGTLPSSAGPIPWKAGRAAITPTGRMDVATALLDLVAERGEGRQHVVVQFNRPVDNTLRAELTANGMQLLDFLGQNAFFAAMDAGRVDVSRLGQVQSLTGVANIKPAWKLHPTLNADRVPDWAIVQTTKDGSMIVAAYVVLHRDVDLDTGSAILRAQGANVRDVLESVRAIIIELPREDLAAVAALDFVQWVEPPLPPMSVVNDGSRIRTEANQAQVSPYELDGFGITVMVYDGGTARGSHADFEDRLSVLDGSGMHYHATHVAGTIGGAGVADAAYTGMAPAATLLSYGFEHDGAGVFLYSNPGDLEDDYDQAINTYGAEISNNSIGTNTELYHDCEIQGDYGVTSNLIDAIVRGSLGGPFRIVWANGNERQGSRCDIEGHGDYYSVAPPATAKNHIAVGAVEHSDDTMSDFSGWGPTDDGRMKPDVAAPGVNVTSCGDGSDTDYRTLSGTSMAAPATTGCAALLMQDFKAQFPGQALLRNSTLKALLAHTAQDRFYAGPDYRFGYGSVRIRRAIDLMRTGAFLENTITQGITFSRTVQVTAGDQALKVTLVWDDYPGTPNVTPALVNDLDLRVWSPSGARHYPWTLDPDHPGEPAVRTQENHIDNIEQVFVETPEAGTWTIEVHGHAVPEGPQPFSLVGDGAMNVNTSISFPNGLEDIVLPGTPTVIDVRIVSIGEETVAGSPTLHWRYDDGAFQIAALTHTGGELYEATLPLATCGDTPEYYFSAEGTLSGAVVEPVGAPSGAYSLAVGELETYFTDSFEFDQGWTVQNSTGLEDGPWERGVPIDCNRGDPPTDYDGSGQCFLTDNSAADGCNSDVDGGTTWLISPTLNLADGDAEITYALWYTNDYGADPDNDHFVVWVSDDNGSSWTEVITFGPDSSSGWSVHTFNVADFVTPTSQVRVRFEASDLSDGSVVEAGIDAFEVTQFICVGPTLCAGDMNCDGVVDFSDIDAFVAALGCPGGAPECWDSTCPWLNGDGNGDATVNFDDIDPFVARIGATCP